MIDTDKLEFAKAITSMLYLTNGTRSPDKQIILAYWRACLKFELPDVLKAIETLSEESERHVPPGALVRQITGSPIDASTAAFKPFPPAEVMSEAEYEAAKAQLNKMKLLHPELYK